MHAFAAAGAAFLIAVLWFDLMFDVQVRGRPEGTLPPQVLASISAYYRRVTTDASPMGRLVTVAMAVTVVALGLTIVRSPWVGAISLTAALSAIGLAATRTVRNAVRLGRAADSAQECSALARSIYRDHQFCLAAMSLVLILQLSLGHG